MHRHVPWGAILGARGAVPWGQRVEKRVENLDLRASRATRIVHRIDPGCFRGEGWPGGMIDRVEGREEMGRGGQRDAARSAGEPGDALLSPLCTHGRLSRGPRKMTACGCPAFPGRREAATPGPLHLKKKKKNFQDPTECRFKEMGEISDGRGGGAGSVPKDGGAGSQMCGSGGGWGGGGCSHEGVPKAWPGLRASSSGATGPCPGCAPLRLPRLPRTSRRWG